MKIMRPVVDLLLEINESPDDMLPDLLLRNSAVQCQVALRNELLALCEGVFECIPDVTMDVEEALACDLIEETVLVELYEKLGCFLDEDRNHARLVLYLPFELLPRMNRTDLMVSERLQYVREQFTESYMRSWRRLLGICDVRANFVDGDVLEIEHRVRDLPRVVKAAHLIPLLVQCGFIAVTDVIALMEENDDEILKQSIADALSVLADLGYIPDALIHSMEVSRDRLVSSMAHIITAVQASRDNIQTQLAVLSVTYSYIQRHLRARFMEIEEADYGQIAAKRRKWLVQTKKLDAIERTGVCIAYAICEDNFIFDEVSKFFSTNADTNSQHALAEGIRRAIELLAATDFKRAIACYQLYEDTLCAFWNRSRDHEFTNVLSRLFCHFHGLGIIGSDTLSQLGIAVPDLSRDISARLAALADEMEKIQSCVGSIMSHPELSEIIYPIVIVYGSRIKGYGTEHNDIDKAVIVRPGIPLDRRERLGVLLKDIFAYNGTDDPVVEFWTAEQGHELHIQNFSDPDVTLGASYLTGTLFGGVWVGDKRAIRELYEALLVPYLHDSGQLLHGRNARGLYLEELERDTLMYRLLHRGYERYFPSRGGINTPHARDIDGDSTFWDSGYRRLAMDLFLSKVFIPKIGRK